MRLSPTAGIGMTMYDPRMSGHWCFPQDQTVAGEYPYTTGSKMKY